jgi:hypothetical protein
MRDISQLSNEELLRQAQNLDVISQASPSLTQLSNEELLRQAQQAGITPVSQPQAPGMGEAFGRGLLQGGKRAVSGALQAGADVAGALFPESEGVQQFRELIPEAVKRGRQQFEAQVGDSTAAKVGEFIGEAAPFVAALPAGGATLLGRTAAGAVGGGLASGLAPTEQQLAPEEALAERGEQALIGGTIGAAIPGAVKAVKPVSKAIVNRVGNLAGNLAGKIVKINPEASKRFLDAGIQQSLAMVADSPAIKLFDRTLSKFPGGAGVIQKNTEKTLNDITNFVDELSAKKAVTKEEAGILVKKGIKKYADRFKKTSDKLYNRLDNFLPQKRPVNVASSLQALDQELTDATLTPGLAARLQKNEGIKVLEDIKNDSIDGNMAYGALKKYRSLVGEKLNDFTLLGTEDRAVLKKAYKALSKDMEQAALRANPKAAQAWNRANNFYKRGAERIDELEDIVKKDSEVVYDTILQRTKQGGTRINKVMKALDPNERDAVRSTVMHRLGLEKPGVGGAEPGFSARTFLTNWKSLAPEAKKALFGRGLTQYSQDLDKLSKIVGDITSLDRFANPSGTAQQTAMLYFLGGSFIQAPSAIALALGANASSRLMNNQKFINWLVKNQDVKTVTPKTINDRINKLKDIAKSETAIAEDIAQYLGILSLTLQRGKDGRNNQ